MGFETMGVAVVYSDMQESSVWRRKSYSGISLGRFGSKVNGSSNMFSLKWMPKMLSL